MFQSRLDNQMDSQAGSLIGRVKREVSDDMICPMATSGCLTELLHFSMFSIRPDLIIVGPSDKTINRS